MEREVAIDNNAELEQLVADAEHGEAVVLTRDGIAVARIVPTVLSEDRGGAIEAMRNIRALSESISLGEGTRLSDLRHEGHKY